MPSTTSSGKLAASAAGKAAHNEKYASTPASPASAWRRVKILSVIVLPALIFLMKIKTHSLHSIWRQGPYSPERRMARDASV
jgi:hypothetical protein